MSELFLLVPGLTAPPPAALGQRTADRSLVAKLLARADHSTLPGVDYEATLCALFGIDVTARDAPVAALRRIGLGLACDSRFWVLAEPVCLRPDQSRLLLFDTVDFDVESRELEALGRVFRRHFLRDGWVIDIAEPGHWYLSPDTEAVVTSHNLGEVFGRNLDLFLPSGRDRLEWHALLNEAQMLLFAQTVNQQREAVGKMPVNGIWLSGFGRLPDRISGRFARIVGGGPLARGLAALAGGIHADGPPATSPASVTEDTLLVYPGLMRPCWRVDPFSWWAQLEIFEHWLQPSLGALRQGKLDTLLLGGCDGNLFRLQRRHLLRFWRAAKPLSAWSRQP